MDWTAPGVEEVAPGVHRIPLPMPNDGLRAVNVYALTGPDGCTLIDAGWRVAEAEAALDEALRTLGLGRSDLGRCLVTHHHRDHLTLAQELRRGAGVRIALGEGERENLAAVRDPERMATGPHARRLREAGAEPVTERLARLMQAAGGTDRPDPADFADPDEWLAAGDVVTTEDRALRVVSTPGHTRGHVIYVDDAAELMFTGDHVLPHITPSIGFEAAPVASPLGDYLRSLALTLQEPDRLLLPAHGPAGGSVRTRTAELLEHHEVRLRATEDAVRSGAATGYEVARQLPWTRRGRRFDELDPFNQMLAVSETVAHLEVLRAQHRITRSRDGEHVVWTA